MKLENFAILVRTDGVTGQLVLTAAELQLFCRIVIGTLADINGITKIVPIKSIELTANPQLPP